MRTALTFGIGIAVLVLLGLSVVLVARTGKFHGHEALSYVAPTDVPQTKRPGRVMALCHMTETFTIRNAPYYIRNRGYVLSDETCSGVFYYPIDDTAMARLQADGMVSADLPLHPRLTFRQTGLIWLWLLIPIILIVVAIVTNRQKRDWEFGREETREATLPMLRVLLRAAAALGPVGEAEAKRIAGTIRHLTGIRVDDTEIAALAADRPEEIFSEDAVIGQDLAVGQREKIVQAVLLNFGSEASWQGPERAFVADLTRRLGVSEEQMGLIRADVDATFKRAAV